MRKSPNFTATRAFADQRLSLQTLIDCVPDYLWVKDAEGRFVIVNKALASNSGRTNTSDMIGLSDFDLHAAGSRAAISHDEEDIIRSGQPMINREEVVSTRRRKQVALVDESAGAQ